MTEAINIISNVLHEMAWENLLVVITFLISLSVGAFLISSLSTVFGREKYKALSKIGAIVATVAVIIGMMLLIVDITQPTRFWHLFMYFNFSSPITWGTILLGLYLINSVVYLGLLTKEDAKVKTFGIIGVALALAVVLYQGFEFGIVEARALWSTALLPAYFLISALLLGAALLVLASVVTKTESEVTNGLGEMLAWFILAGLFVAFSHVVVLSNSGAEAQAAVALLLGNQMFLGVGIVLGGIMPLAILSIPNVGKTIAGQTIASVLVLLGVYAIRYSIVIGGQAIPLS